MKQFFSRFIFLIVLFCAAQAHALTSGSTTTGSISTPGAISYQSFTATAGQGVILQGLSANYGVHIKVYKPDTTLWTASTNRVSGTLPATGTYSVEITATSPTSGTGSYDLAYVQGGGSVSSGTISSGQSYSGTLTENGLMSYQFNGTAGQGYMLYGYSPDFPIAINVYKPDGSLWDVSSGGRLIANLPNTGTYTVVVRGSGPSNNGDYHLDLLIGAGNVSSGSISSGQSTDGTLIENGIASYQFEGAAGEDIFLYSEAAAYLSVIRAYKPDGSLLATSAGSRINTTLTNTGTYTVALYGNGNSNAGDYRLDFVKGNDNVSDGTLLTGSTRGGSLQLNGLESYKFSGIATGSLLATTTGSYTRKISILNPDGSFWKGGSNTVTGTLSNTGEHTLVLYGSTSSHSGANTVTVTTPPGAVAASTPSKVGAKYTACSVDDNMTGNPVNFDLGFKKQKAVDYNAGGLTFSRIYRSDSTWTDNTIGALWRHNYARTLSVSGGSASVTDGTGATIQYTSSGGNWAPNDSNTMSTLENDGSGGYIYTYPDNTVEKYNSSKLLTRIEYLGGGALNLGYNMSNQLTSVTNENGRVLTLGYTSNRVSSLLTPDGTFTYTYDGNGNLDEVTQPDTYTTEYHYENGSFVNALTGITDQAGIRFSSVTYNGSGKATLTEHAGNTYDYNVAYGTDASTVTTPLGKGQNYTFTNIQGVRKAVQLYLSSSTYSPAATQYFNYDSLGRMIGVTDWEGITTRYAYDSRSNITKLIEAQGTADQRTTTYTYDPNFNLPDVIKQPGKTTDYDYDVYGRMTSMTVTDTATSATRITTYTYHSNGTDGSGNVILGRLAQVDGPRTDVSDITEYDYDGNYDLNKITNALGQETLITARDAAGRPATIEDPNGVETDLVYSSAGRLTRSTVAPGTALEAETVYAYDPNGNLSQITLPNNVSVQYTYDNAQRLTGVEDALGNTITYTLDADGNVTQQDIRDSGAALKYTHDQVFDEMSRLIESIGASGQDSDYAYDKNSNLTQFTDANNNVTRYAYDALIRFISSTDAINGVTELDWNGLDDVTSVEDPRNNATTYTYNAFGDVLSETSPDRGTTTYLVDKAGNITKRTDARGVVTDYTWDALNRVTDVEYPSDGSLDVTLTYDLTSGCGTAGIGQLCTVVDASGTTAYEYNDLGQLTDVTETRGGLTFTTGYTYDLAGNVLTITLDSGRVITYTRNANGQVSGVSGTVVGSGTVQFSSAVTYLPFGPMSGMTYGNGRTFSATYDQDYNPTNRTVSTIYNNSYDTDDVGNIIETGSIDYGYDALNRLDEENPGSATTYTYDAANNRLTKVSGGTTTSTVPGTSNKISAVGGTSIVYNSAGAFTSYGTSGYVWNAAGLLAESKVSGSTVGAYTYNASNQRTKKVAGGNTTHYVYGLNGLLYGEYTNAGALIKEYVYLNDQPLAQINAGSPEVLTYLHPDHLGTPKFGTNSGGTQVWAANTDAFGVGTPSGSATVNLRLPGQYYDSESGLFYNWNRYYHPALGRYISSDPIGLEGGPNTFNYASVSPVMFIDPEGLTTGAYYVEGGEPISLRSQGAAAGAVLLGAASKFGAPGAVAATALTTSAAAGYYGVGIFGDDIEGYLTTRAKKKWATKNQTAVSAATSAPAPSAPNVCQVDPIFMQGLNSEPANDNNRPRLYDEEFWQDLENAGKGVSSSPQPPDPDEICYERCKHLLPSPSGDLQASEYRACYRECKGSF